MAELIGKPPRQSKRDSSYLDWHYKQPNDEELKEKYLCFTDDEWAGHYQASKEASSLPARKKNDPAIFNKEAKLAACDGCQLFYQLWARRRGLCHPVDGAVTPLDKLIVGDHDEED
jgi:hypothetical protein